MGRLGAISPAPNNRELCRRNLWKKEVSLTEAQSLTRTKICESCSCILFTRGSLALKFGLLKVCTEGV